jgi:hypothetical protein
MWLMEIAYPAISPTLFTNHRFYPAVGIKAKSALNNAG